MVSGLSPLARGNRPCLTSPSGPPGPIPARTGQPSQPYELTNDYLTPKALNALMDSGEIKRYLPDWSGDPESSHFDHSSVGTLFFAWMNRSPRVPRLAARYRAETQRMGKLRALNESDAKQEQFIAFVLSHEPPDVGQFAD